MIEYTKETKTQFAEAVVRSELYTFFKKMEEAVIPPGMRERVLHYEASVEDYYNDESQDELRIQYVRMTVLQYGEEVSEYVTSVLEDSWTKDQRQYSEIAATDEDIAWWLDNSGKLLVDDIERVYSDIYYGLERESEGQFSFNVGEVRVDMGKKPARIFFEVSDD